MIVTPEGVPVAPSAEFIRPGSGGDRNSCGPPPCLYGLRRQRAEAEEGLDAKSEDRDSLPGRHSQTAFTAGALKGLLESQIADEVDLISVSDASGGAACAALVWYALEMEERPHWGRLIDF